MSQWYKYVFCTQWFFFSLKLTVPRSFELCFSTLTVSREHWLTHSLQGPWHSQAFQKCTWMVAGSFPWQWKVPVTLQRTSSAIYPHCPGKPTRRQSWLLPIGSPMLVEQLNAFYQRCSFLQMHPECGFPLLLVKVFHWVEKKKTDLGVF